MNADHMDEADVSEIDMRSNNQRLFIGLVNISKQELRFKQIIKVLKDNMSIFSTSYWEGLFFKYAPEDVPIVNQKTNEELEQVLEMLDIYEEAFDNIEEPLTQSFFKPRSVGTCIFSKNIKVIANHLFVQNESMEDVAKFYKINKSNMKE